MAEIKLSPDLFTDIQQAVRKQQPDADNGVVLQYLAAVSGYLLGGERGLSKADKDRFLGDLSRFAEQVCNDVHAQQEQPQAQPQPAASDSALGYWKPAGK